jgi:hypothetical protein
MRVLFVLLRLLTVPQPYAWAAAVFVDERCLAQARLNAGKFNS